MTPYPEQIQAAKIAAKSHRGIIHAVTGSGKSLIAALIINELQVRTIIIVPSLELKSQLSESMSNWFGPAKVGPNKDIYIENIQALDPKQPLNYDCLIIDEFHHSASSSYRKLNQKALNGVYYRFGLTATPWRSDVEEKLLLESILSEVIYEIPYATAKGRIVVPVEGFYVEIPKQKTDAYTWAEVYKELVVENMPRNIIIANLLTDLHTAGRSTLCLVKEVKHGELLQELTGLPFVSGADDTSRKHIHRFNKGQIKVLIATTGIMGEGVDSKPAEFVLVAGLGKAKTQFMQQIGRGIRKYPGKESCKVIIVKDKSHKFLTRHFKAQSDILDKEYDAKPVKLDI